MGFLPQTIPLLIPPRQHALNILLELGFNFLAGDIPLAVVALLSKMRFDHRAETSEGEISLANAGPGFTLPTNIGDLDSSISNLILTDCFLTGGGTAAQPTNQQAALLLSC